MKLKKLIWRDLVTDYGKELGYVHLIGEFLIRGCTFTKYHISNSYAGGEILNKIMIFDPLEDNEIAAFITEGEAKEFAQTHFEAYVKEIFYENIYE
jgi:hypothetical protein